MINTFMSKFDKLVNEFTNPSVQSDSEVDEVVKSVIRDFLDSVITKPAPVKPSPTPVRKPAPVRPFTSPTPRPTPRPSGEK